MSSHQRSKSEGVPTPHLAQVKNWSKIADPVVSQTVMSLTTEESNVLVDDNGNLRDELGFLVSAPAAEGAESGAAAGSVLASSDTTTLQTAVTDQQQQQPFATNGMAKQESGKRISAQSDGIILNFSWSMQPQSFKLAQHKAWEDFLNSIGGSIHNMTFVELQRWRKLSLDMTKDPPSRYFFVCAQSVSSNTCSRHNAF